MPATVRHTRYGEHSRRGLPRSERRVVTLALAALTMLGGLLGPAPARARCHAWCAQLRAVRAATANVDGRCRGVLVDDRQTVLTAAHCVRRGERKLAIEIGGQVHRAVVQWLHRGRDLALVHLRKAAAGRPLAVARELPELDQQLLYAGGADASAQRVKIQRLARCPSLPCVEKALFTTLNARPGDSGSPLVDREGRVVGLVHGGASCHIAAPTHHVGKWLSLPNAARCGLDSALRSARCGGATPPSCPTSQPRPH